MKNSGAQTILDSTSKSKAEQLMNKQQLEAYQDFLAAKAYQAFAIKRRDSKNITADFYFALEKAGFERIKVHNKRYFKGLRLRAENDAEEDFLN